MCRRNSATRIGTVHDVVVEQGKPVQKLDGRAHFDDAMISRISSEGNKCPIRKRRTQAFPPTQRETANLLNRECEIFIE
jgi:hypothetical protein